jgi:large subunit ribosomal protein L44
LFNIGLFLSNGLKLAEGHGSSLRMAEHRAAENALFSLFLVKNADSSVTLPTAIHAERPYAAGAKAVTEPAAVEKQFVPHSAAAGTESLHGLSPRRNAAI